jgi:formamidopyrimidine-DNA glycosylase
MPELPEVETIRRELATEVSGRRIEHLKVTKLDILLGPRTLAAFRRRLEGLRIDGVDRRAKYLLFRFETGDLMQVQVRMTGRFAIGHASPDPEEFRHIAAELRLDDGRTLYYDDVRRLGGFRILGTSDWADLERRLGPEPLEPGFTGACLSRILADRRAPVKNVIMDQRRIAGVGNIYASEALYAARIDPLRPAGSLELPEIRRLHRAIRRTLTVALEHAGTTFRNYRAVNGRSGSFQSLLRVYGREGEPCRRCSKPIVRVVQAGRSTFCCARCQR